MSDFSNDTMRRTVHWATWLAEDWKGEYPLKLHSGGLASDGSPEWHPDFQKWLTRNDGRGKRNETQRLRTTRVMRSLRKVAPREYEVTYRILILGERISSTTQWLNQRAAKNDIPFPNHRPEGPHYTQKDTWALFIAAIDFARTFW